MAEPMTLEQIKERANQIARTHGDSYRNITNLAADIERLTTDATTAATQERERLLWLLRQARCPDCDGSGSCVETVDDPPVPVQVPCQWCDEKAKALATGGGG